ncbi:hypothetical protein SAMN05444722_0275 [Rhodovulum sp. ES.010]|uniref:hypothetical protein n=1 Tax=Rhodovulum sp. ES.010 TaxID=1882821 RepID=UPI0009263FDE|nr:hypothetical protein [Rhodovulum sp. ES.010]SIO06109.1 hypothetical protein SAMN05444722_0275 [Rhodovulum sp. ES.010]
MTGDEVERFSWQAGPDAPREELLLDADGLALEGRWRLDWDAVTGLIYRADRWTETLDIAADGKLHRLTFEGAATDREGPRAMRAVVARLAERRPEISVEMRRGGWARWIGFGLGLVCLLGGLALWARAAVAGDAISGAVGFMVLILVGVALASTNRPGRAGRPIPPEIFRAYLDGRAPGAHGTKA